GQATWHATDWLRFTLGARFSHDLSYNFVNTDYNFFNDGRKLQTKIDKLTGKAGVELDLAPGSMLYASWSRGYKSGGANNNQTPLVVPLIYGPEVVESYEVGSKNRFLDNTLQINLSAFYYNYSNFQYLEGDPVPFQGGVANIPKVNVWGG